MRTYALGALGALVAVALVVYLSAVRPLESAPAAAPLAAVATVAKPAPGRAQRGPFSFAADELRHVAVGKDHRLALVDPAPRLPLQVPAGASLRLAFTLEMAKLKRLQDLAVDFVATFTADGVERELLRRRVDHDTAVGWQEATLDLSAEAGERGILQLRGEVVHGELPLADLVVWAPPALRLAAAAARRSIILVSIDTLRSDHLGCYGYGRDTSPAIDALAAQGTLFRHAVAPSTWTLPSHASLLTGVTPSRHGAVRFPLGTKLSAGVETLAEYLHDAGYATAGFTDGGYVSAAFGFYRGFERFLYGPARNDDTGDHLEERIALARDWMQWTSGRPFFLFLHTYAVHSPYAPAAPYNQMFGLDQSPFRFEVGEEEEHQWLGRIEDEPALLDYIKALYDAEIRQTDATLGRFFTDLAASGLGEHTCVIVTSDHGEEFTEHDRLFHNRADVYEELLRVPLVVRCAGDFAAGQVIDEPVSLIDVTPTVLDLAGVEASGQVEGMSLVPSLRGGAVPAPRILLSETDGSMERRPGAVISQRSGRYKLVTSTWRKTPGLYDLEDDPEERNDISAEKPDLVATLERELPAANREALRPDRPAERERPTPDPAVLERLRALGYLQDGD